MATLLIASPAKETRGQDLKRTLLHILHGLQAIEDALEKFSLAYSPHDTLLSESEPKVILADFDAHVGDTACHMRAQMIWEVYQHYRETESRVWIDEALIALGQVKADTVALMLALYKKNGYMRALGFGSRVQYGQIFDRIGWSFFVDMFDNRTGSRRRSRRRFDSWCSEVSTPVTLTPAWSESDQTVYDFKTDYSRVNTQPSLGRDPQRCASRASSTSSNLSSLLHSRDVSPGWSPLKSPPSPPLPSFQPSGSHGYRSTNTECSWDITNHLSIIRFLSLCRLLSVGKKAKVQAGFPSAAIRARTGPEFIYEQTSKVTQTYYESAEQEVPWSKLITWEDMAKKAFLTREEEAVQVWLSKLTADWSVKLAGEIGLTASMQRWIIFRNAFLAITYTTIFQLYSVINVDQPKTNLLRSFSRFHCPYPCGMVAPRYPHPDANPTVLFKRSAIIFSGHSWTHLISGMNRFLGYHSTFYKVSPNPAAWQARPPFKNLCAVNMGRASWFTIVSASMAEVQSSPWAATPHFVLISNSIEGTRGKFYDRIAEDGYGELGNPWPHDADYCEEHEAHLPKVLESNFASIIMGFFGQHDQYPFDFSPESEGCSDEDGHKHVAKKMVDAGFGGRALEQYWRSCEESVESGTGEHPRLYTFEHAYLEFPFVVGRQVQEIMEKRIKPVPIGYRRWL